MLIPVYKFEDTTGGSHPFFSIHRGWDDELYIETSQRDCPDGFQDVELIGIGTINVGDEFLNIYYEEGFWLYQYLPPEAGGMDWKLN